VAEKLPLGEVENETPENAADNLLKPVPEDGIKRRWYALHVHSGQEGNACDMLMAGAQSLDNPNFITNVLVPMEKVAEIRSGEKKVSKRKFFPGYVLIQLPEHPERYADLWQLIKETPGVTGFIGSRNAAVPLEDSEVMAVVEVARGERERPKPKVDFSKGQRVKITEGPFANFLGNVDDINPETGTMKIMVEIFERLTSIEVEFWQVEAI
jgi:transcriptional antiterminator NusG